ncbi:hypothetical protein D0865_16057 [Hortaea werneckii]|uniref:CENP-V/GFA domain-containing protein n=1 Tax=Hortaea werneckii TaxID=91943 RepID=A0A3M7AIG4_HORWE|nr:hypothetical protein D0865_16057 [Hortaea werneckii]RMY62645.1 hypothetical protein D0863_10889 [Hortaea werneckii]
MTDRTATCLCGKCHIKLDKITQTALCHCMTCRKRTGSAFAIIATIPNEAFHLERGTPQSESTHTGSGNIHFCADCRCTLWAEFNIMPTAKFVRAGLVDGEDMFDLAEMKPSFEVFTKRRPHWWCAVEGAAQMEEGFKLPKT